jgi:hypothetical protein
VRRSGAVDAAVGDVRVFIAEGPAAWSGLRAVVVTDPLGRAVRTVDKRAGGCGSLFLRSFMVPLASDRTDDGRATLGVPKIDDSRRELGLAVGAVVLAFDSPTVLFTCSEG